MIAEIHRMSDYRAPAHVPKAITALNNWVVWRFEPNEKNPDKPLKMPYYVSGRRRAGVQGSPEDRAALGSYERAVAACQRGGYTGIGLALLPGDGLVALDFDNCVTDGLIDPRVAALVEGTYAEFSPSGTGIRAFMLGNLESKKDTDRGRKDGRFDIEFFGTNGFVTFTGNATPDCALMGYDEAIPLTDAVHALYKQRFGSDGALVVRNQSTGADDDLLSLTSTLGWTIEQARGYLFDCNPDAPRAQWLNALMAVHHELGGSPEALALVDEWSSQASNYGGRDDVLGRWRSFGKSGGAAITGLWLLKWRSECLAHKKYEAATEWKKELASVNDEFTLREKLCPKISKDERLDEMAREALAQALFESFKRMGTKYPIAQCRKLIAEKRVEKSITNSSLPEWLQGWVYVTDDDMFYRTDTEEWLSMQSFNAKFNRLMPVGEDGTITKSASWTALENYQITTAVRALYLPWAGPTFDLEGVACVNTYRPSSVPEAVPVLSSDGREAVAVVMRHLDLLCGGREAVVRTFVNWMAHNVQKPGVKIRWAPLVKGVEGDGKTVIGMLMAAVMGRTNVGNVSPKVLGTDFTGWAEGSAVVVLEEIKLTGHNRYDILNALKPFVTNDSVEVHNKGKDARKHTINTTNYIAFTNYPDALPLTDTDRRWWILFSPFTDIMGLAAVLGDGPARDVLGAYFDRLHNVIEQHRGELRRWLLDHPIDADFKPNGSAPLTDEKAVMIGMSQSEEEIAVKDALEKGGPGVTEAVFLSSYLRDALFHSGAEVDLATSAWSRLLSKIGYTRMPKKLKWKGKSENVWVKGHRNMEPEVLRMALVKTMPNGVEGSENDDLF